MFLKKECDYLLYYTSFYKVLFRIFQVASNKIVVDFFLSRPSDPVPYREPPDGAASDKHYKDVISDDELDDENEDDILFER